MKYIRKNAFIPMCSVFLNIWEVIALEDWTLRAKGSEINGMQFSPICDRFLAFYTYQRLSDEQKQLLTRRLFLQVSSSHFLLSFPDLSFLFCTE